MKPKLAEIALEAKRRFIPYITQKFPEWPTSSFVHSGPTADDSLHASNQHTKLRVAVICGDPVDVALDWFEAECQSVNHSKLAVDERASLRRIPVVNMANERRPGGDWESGVVAPEENLCRRSNLAKCLTSPWKCDTAKGSNYPIPSRGGIYSPSVGMLLASASFRH